MEKKNGVNYSLLSKVKSRRKNVIEHLEAQLKTGTKNDFKEVLPLTDHDRTRINRELEILKSRI